MIRHIVPPVRGRSSLRLLRLRAALAGGLVLGLGATATLAAWTDTEHVATPIAAGTFEIQGAVALDGAAQQPPTDAAYAAHAAGEAAGTVQLAPPMPAFVPGTVGSQSIYVHTAPGTVDGGRLSTIATTLVDLEPRDEDLRSSLRYDVRASTAPAALVGSCEAMLATAPNGTDTWALAAAGVPTDGAIHETAVPLPAATATAAGAPVRICIRWHLPSDAPSGAQGDAFGVRWQLTASVGS